MRYFFPHVNEGKEQYACNSEYGDHTTRLYSRRVEIQYNLMVSGTAVDTYERIRVYRYLGRLSVYGKSPALLIRDRSKYHPVVIKIRVQDNVSVAHAHDIDTCRIHSLELTFECGVIEISEIDIYIPEHIILGHYRNMYGLTFFEASEPQDAGEEAAAQAVQERMSHGA